MAIHRLVGSGLRMAIDLGASSPSTMCRMVITRKARVRLTECSSAGVAPGISITSGSITQAKAGSPIQPRARLARVMPSWVAER